jgi:hypothetical protein
MKQEALKRDLGAVREFAMSIDGKYLIMLRSIV